MEKKLQVRNLRISFRTSNGKVQAVRGIDFDLAKGETLAIVGESGSGKSVTSKAILGIQAGNAINESGEIIYDGKDLLKISEEEFHKIRGDKIAMIFQDPMSSLNPIVKIGKQLTEAMILKGKARQRESKLNFNSYLKRLDRAMQEAVAQGDSQKAAKISAMCKNFDKFEFKHTHLESAYNDAMEALNDAIPAINVLAFKFEKKAAKTPVERLRDIRTLALRTVNEFVVHEDADRIRELANGLMKQYNASKKTEEFGELIASLYEIRSILEKVKDKPAPNFFRMGYYLVFSGKPLPEMPMEQLNAYLLDYLNKEFMNEFISYAQQAVTHTAKISYQNMQEAITVLRETAPVFQKEKLDKKECAAAVRMLNQKVMATVDPLAITRDSLTHTFTPSLQGEVDTYFKSIGINAKAMKVYNKDKAKYDRIVARGKTPDWQVAAAAVMDQDLIKGNIDHLIDRLVKHYEQMLSVQNERDFAKETIAVIDYLKENASGVVTKVTRRTAKDRAIKLMDEVGIAQPHKRFNQYPFEFSGGMRQRIVIAIALAANPDILICDEPTTALDVTIQSQILELINKLKRERQLSVIFITHDLGVVTNMADNVAVMYAGKIVEYGTADDIFYDAAHPYTWALLSSMPDLDTNEKLDAIPGTPPNMIYPPVGDAFAARNKYAMQIDFEKQPPMFKISETHSAATWLLHPDAPKVEKPKIIQDRIARMKSKRGEEDAK